LAGGGAVAMTKMTGFQSWAAVAQRLALWTALLWYTHVPALWVAIGTLLAIDAGLDVAHDVLAQAELPEAWLIRSTQATVLTAAAIALLAHLEHAHHDPMALLALFAVAACLRLALLDEPVAKAMTTAPSTLTLTSTRTTASRTRTVLRLRPSASS